MFKFFAEVDSQFRKGIADAIGLAITSVTNLLNQIDLVLWKCTLGGMTKLTDSWRYDETYLANPVA